MDTYPQVDTLLIYLTKFFKQAEVDKCPDVKSGHPEESFGFAQGKLRDDGSHSYLITNYELQITLPNF